VLGLALMAWLALWRAMIAARCPNCMPRSSCLAMGQAGPGSWRVPMNAGRWSRQRWCGQVVRRRLAGG
jgi:hypothetical protein